MERYKEVLLLPRRQFYVHFYVNRAASSPVARDHWGIFELGVMGKGRKNEASHHSPLALYAPSHHPSLALLACSRVPQSPLSLGKACGGGSQQGSILKWHSFKISSFSRRWNYSLLPTSALLLRPLCQRLWCFSHFIIYIIIYIYMYIYIYILQLFKMKLMLSHHMVFNFIVSTEWTILA